ncbi:DUF6328 family protein [Egicoccus sp. AB-alg6-2]|uniref:DUF6328 family protein n=1 Tax=Egicoccus sp. AB-alg6-2 TaxID=3242692 RepID=UPI00359E44DE
MTDTLHDDSGLADRHQGEPADSGQADGGDEERERYRELLEELRTILPGVQVLFAFLLVAPFSQRFGDLDELGRDLYAVVLLLTGLAAALFLAPASYHRIGERRRRRERLHTAIRLMVVGMLLLATAMVLAIYTVMRFIFEGSLIAAGVAGGLAGVIALLWYVIPLALRVQNGNG